MEARRSPTIQRRGATVRGGTLIQEKVACKIGICDRSVEHACRKGGAGMMMVSTRESWELG